jgi:hypothetical protein
MFMQRNKTESKAEVMFYSQSHVVVSMVLPVPKLFISGLACLIKYPRV